MFEKLKKLLKSVTSESYQLMSEVYTKNEFIWVNESLKDFNKEFLSFFEKLLEVKIQEVQYVIVKDWRFWLLIKKYTWELKEDDVKEYLEESDYSFYWKDFVLFLD